MMYAALRDEPLRRRRPLRTLRGRALALFTACLMTTACGGAKVAMTGDIPVPLVKPLPLRIGVYLDPALTQYVFEEKIADHGDWRVEVGPMQARMFRQVATAMFVEARPVESPTSAPGLDAVLAPTIAEFQIAIPSQTRSELYEVWIKYVLRLYDPQGSLIAEWPLTAYGKSNQGDFGLVGGSGGEDDAIRHATTVALRDAGAFLALRFTSVPEVRAWLAARTPPPPGSTP